MTPTRFPPGVPCWVELTGAEPMPAAEFYAATFGWSVDALGVARLGGRVVAGIDGAPAVEGPARWSTAIACDDVDAATAAVVDHGGQVRTAPSTVHHMARVALASDPSGVPFGLWEPAPGVGAEAVNVPGAWNWSDLATPDPDGAATFYGAAFGWRAVPMPAFGATMWQLPGYSAHLDALDPERAERHDAPGVPEGFGDAVGWLRAPAEGEDPGWVVTFAVDDADAVVDRAVATGASVVVAPHDLGPTRVAVVDDPAGARFTVSHYRPG